VGIIPVIVFVLVAVFHQPAPPPPPPPAPAPIERVVLMPDADGKVGKVVVTNRAGAEQTIDQAWQTAVVNRGGSMELKPGDATAESARYATLLTARPPAVLSFNVTFETGSSRLNAGARAVFENVRAELARRPVPEVLVIGHTDRVGTVAANDALSLARAGTVRTLLVEFGIPAAQIEISGRGEREPLVPTADEVPEERNRRVEITVR